MTSRRKIKFGQLDSTETSKEGVNGLFGKLDDKQS